jgi:hypothetical protein
MKLDSLHRKLIQAAKRDQPSDSVPYAFEQRIMAAWLTCRRWTLGAIGRLPCGGQPPPVC